jgi:hypothetical protein
MSRTAWHLVYSLLWLVGVILVFIVASPYLHSSDVGKNQFRSQVGSIAWMLGFAGIFYSWARQDAIDHGKPKHSAVLFAALWPFLILIAHIAYLFYTRGLRNGFVAFLKFVSFLLALGIGFVVLGRIVSLVFD